MLVKTCLIQSNRMLKWTAKLSSLFSLPSDQSVSFGGNSTFEVSSLGDGVRSSDLQDLKTNAVKCLTDGFFKKLLDLEEVCVCVWGGGGVHMCGYQELSSNAMHMHAYTINCT